MLPKVANQLLHHTARAISVAQNQTGHTIRNVLQLQSSSTPSTASGNFGGWNGASSSHSNWNSRGAGSGGAKFHPGGRSYTGYTGAGRAVTQAETVSVDDGQTFNDDSDDVPPGLRRGDRPLKSRRPSAPSRPRSCTSLAVIRTVQSQTKSRPPFAGQTTVDSPSGTGLSTQATALLLHRLSARQGTARLHSTVADVQTVSDYLDVESPPGPSSSLQPSNASLSRPHTPASSLPTPPPEAEEESPDSDDADFKAFREAVENKDVDRVTQLVQDIRSRPNQPSVRVFNAALAALRDVRLHHQSLRCILEVYNDMLTRSVAPNFKTYTTLIRCFTDRDRSVRDILQRLERRSRWQTTFGGQPSVQDHKYIASLHSEANLRSAMMLFQTACAIPYTKMPRQVYHDLLESCANHANVDAAIHVFAHLERRTDILPSARTFQLLMSVYMAAADWPAVKDVFDEFRNACKSGRIDATLAFDDGSEQAEHLIRGSCINVWTAMLEAYVRSGQHTAALGLLEQMLDTKAGDVFNVVDTPPPSVVTFRRLIASFCETGDISTALAWFDRLLLQEIGPRSRLDASVTPCRPDYLTWSAIIEALCLNDRVDDLLKVMSSFERFAPKDNLNPLEEDLTLVLQAYFHHLNVHADLDESKLASIVNGIMALVARCGHRLLTFRVIGETSPVDLGPALSLLLLSRRNGNDAIRVASTYVEHRLSDVSDSVTAEVAEESLSKLHTLGDFVLMFGHRCSELDGVTLQGALVVAELFWRLRIRTPQPVVAWCVRHYATARTNAAGLPTLSLKEWQLLLRVVSEAEENIVAIEDVLEDVQRAGLPLESFPVSTRARLHLRLRGQKDESYAREIMVRYDRQFHQVAAHMASWEVNQNIDGPQQSEAASISPSVKVDAEHSSFVAQFWPIPNARISPLVAYQRFEAGRTQGRYPRPEVLAHLISVLGREREFEKVKNLYESAQLVLQTYEDDKARQSYAWFLVEDSMILALAHGGDVNAAHVHRARILDHGGIPSADAYGALIHNVKDTTDDSHNAIELFREALSRGVVPNIFLYNTVISKLAKARKADDALALFQEMRTHGVRPSSVTYGAVIAACCRVGDVSSAEALFAEMVAQPVFKPRVPPYNTMMQLYTTTRPDRARVLHYFNAMISTGVKPTAHTYKLLLDAYGSIEPVDAPAMEKVFREVTSGPRPAVQGTHWASLIHSVGCVQKDLDRALALFDSIADHPSSRTSGAQLPDAVVFESLINVLSAHRRVDLIPTYLSRLKSFGIHMTAYIANLLIKAYASAGDIERARDIFEGLADPPEGIAAPHNHVPHDVQGGDQLHVPVDAPVYREPSTWEAMVRAELGHRNRDRALALLERAQARRFPPAVLNRISGILLDDSVSPWAESA
ncbi:hypothetical protein DAEQUDRAFT_733212 [Daedalea quercina L-15889]|uniref:Pentacotripeptide-repeat region of PRORP domain-containing protein n=1 Tax=Daedalea quercina L-15889 TaxID=1314783 RepID=A0A165L5S8_9APHY|nr:hypothetical protein DAEQUDRAFT_733212 [Daedalea quercina L-15889]